MNFENLFQGEILVFSKNNPHKIESFKYDLFPEEVIPLDEMLMCNFEHLDLSCKEKRDFCKNQREIVSKFQRIDMDKVEAYAKDFAHFVTTLDTDSKFLIRDAGGFLAIYSLFFGFIDETMNFSFEFLNVPFTLFPAELIEGKGSGDFYFTFEYSEDSWMFTLPSLHMHQEEVDLAEEDFKKIA